MDQSKDFKIFDEIFNVLDDISEGNIDGIKILSSLLTIPDDTFEQIKGVLSDSIQDTLNTPDAQIALAQMINQNGLRIEDISDNLDDAIKSIEELAVEGATLSDSKRDFLKQIIISFTNSLADSKTVPHRIISIPIEACRDGAKLPTYATDGSAAMDIYSPEEYTINPGETILIPTGLKVNIPKGYALLIQPRSGLSRKSKLRIPNTPGLIDSKWVVSQWAA